MVGHARRAWRAPGISDWGHLIPTIGARASLTVALASLTLVGGLGLLVSGVAEGRQGEWRPGRS